MSRGMPRLVRRMRSRASLVMRPGGAAFDDKNAAQAPINTLRGMFMVVDDPDLPAPASVQRPDRTLCQRHGDASDHGSAALIAEAGLGSGEPRAVMPPEPANEIWPTRALRQDGRK